MSTTTERAQKIAKEMEESPALAAAVGSLLEPQTKTRIVEGFEDNIDGAMKAILGEYF